MSQSRSGGSQLRFVVYADDPVLGLGAFTILSSLPQFEVLTAESALSSLVPFVEHVRPDVILLHLTPEMTVGFFSILRAAAPHARLILWGQSFSEELRYQAGQIGVAGFLHRGTTRDEFTKNLLDIAGGGDSSAAQEPDNSTTIRLTVRESQLVSLLAQGLRNKEIAACIGITEGTVRIYLSRLFAKIGARDRLEVAVFGLKNAYCGQASWDGKNGFVTERDEDRAKPVLRSLMLIEPQRRRGYLRRATAVGE